MFERCLLFVSCGKAINQWAVMEVLCVLKQVMRNILIAVYLDYSGRAHTVCL